MSDLDSRFQLGEEIQKCQDQIEESRSNIKRLEKQFDDGHDDLRTYHQIKDGFDDFMKRYQSNASRFLEVGSSYSFIKIYENDMNELLLGNRRHRVEECLSSMEGEIRSDISNAEEGINQEQKKRRALNDKLDVLEKEFREGNREDDEC